MACEARQHSDQMLCGLCGLGWDMNDPDPPMCGMKVENRSGNDRREFDAKHLRQRFERWAVLQHLSVTPGTVGDYADPRTQAAWMGCKFGNGLT